MFAWLKPRCPVSTYDKAWIETRMSWLVERFGLETLLNAPVILPSSDEFPAPWDGSIEQTRALFALIGKWMGVPQHAIDLEVVDDFQLPTALAHYDATDATITQYGRPIVRLRRSLLDQPPVLAAALAHELAHDLLLRPGHITCDVPDHEQVTDLLPVMLGLGILLANATIFDMTIREGRASWWLIQRSGYLSSHQLGYALALFARARGEHSPTWSRDLRLDARATLNAGLKFLARTDDCLFHIEPAKRLGPIQSTADCIARLQSRNASLRLATVWRLTEEPPKDAAVIEALIRLLDDRDPDIPGDAARAVGCMNADQAAPAIARLLRMLRSSRENDLLGAMMALATLRAAPDDSLPELIRWLDDDRDRIVQAAAMALAAYGEAPHSILKPLVQLLADRVSRCEPAQEWLAHALCSISVDPLGDVATWLVDVDPETEAAVKLLVADTKANSAAQEQEQTASPAPSTNG
jgi:hypothetical protein